MKARITLAILIVLSMLITSVGLAEDGMLFRRNVSKTPDLETEKSAVFMMDFYVPAQASTGEVGPVDNYCLNDDLSQDKLQGEDCTTGYAYDPRDYAKPLVSVYIDGTTEWQEHLGGGIVLGAFDAFVGVSLDDGTSWRTENLSRSADLSSFTGTKPGVNQGLPFPGGVHNVVHQVAEDKILAVWVSKYCESGFPLYSFSTADNITDNQSYLADLETNYGKNALYLYDLFGVAGTQGSVDYTAEGWPEVGEIPYSCIWAARGKLLPGDDPMTADFVEASHVVWTAPERLTSGTRDANLPAVDCAGGAGCALTWQEDPAGLRPGQGLGPGEGWSGAIANAKTDIWYSYITFADFDLVDSDGDTSTADAVLIEEYEALWGADMDRPKPYVPMAMPVRLTDNDMCKATAGSGTVAGPEDPFCWIDFDSIDDLDNTNIVSFLDNLTGPEDDADFCATSEPWTNPGGTTLDICVTEDGRWMIGRVGATRVRMAIKPYTPVEAVDLDGDGFVEKSAWLSLAAEETKALGITEDVDGTVYDPVDIGKDMFYYSFDFAKPYNLHVNTALDAVDDSAYIVQQGGQLNQPAQCSDWFPTYEDVNPAISCDGHGEFFDPLEDPITGYEYYLTEIARRFALTENNISNITDPADGDSGLASMLIYKQGVIWQGGPADIMLRRVVVDPFCGEEENTDECFDPAVDNPFAFENMECTNPDGTSGWVYPEDVTGQYPTNPNYLQGLCMAPAINLSGTTIKECTEGSGNDTCAATFPVSEDGSIYVEMEDFPKVLEWRQCDGVADIEGCENGVDTTGDLDDQSWENPFDVAKGHRGFLYGDMVMMMYAWSPNWQSNAVGNDHYNLYQRRSFDGGLTWTTTPSDWCGPTDGLCGDGVDALEFYYGDTIGDFVPYVWGYEAGEFEQARNLSLLHGNKVTILDPRYSPPGGLKQYSTIRTDWLETNSDLIGFTSDQVLPYPDDEAIDPSKYYMVYETGDNTTVAEGEAVPLDLFYSRATVFGDVYEWFDYEKDDLDGNPVDGELELTDVIEPRWPWLENQTDDLSGEASVVLNPGGTFAYNVWNQWQEEILPDGHELVHDSDMWYRRVMWVSDLDLLSTDFQPISSIVYVSTDKADYDDEDIVLVGSSRDVDRVGNNDANDDGIVQEGWWDVLNDESHFYEGRLFQRPPNGFIPGKHDFSFQAQDNEGNWSSPDTVSIWVAEKFYNTYLPIVTR
jgi:hypothetical protein